MHARKFHAWFVKNVRESQLWPRNHQPWTFRLWSFIEINPPTRFQPLYRASTMQRIRKTKQSDERQRVISLDRALAPLSRVPLDTLAKLTTFTPPAMHLMVPRFCFVDCSHRPHPPFSATHVHLAKECFLHLRSAPRFMRKFYLRFFHAGSSVLSHRLVFDRCFWNRRF